jgi:hypothetical protein
MNWELIVKLAPQLLPMIGELDEALTTFESAPVQKAIATLRKVGSIIQTAQGQINAQSSSGSLAGSVLPFGPGR